MEAKLDGLRAAAEKAETLTELFERWKEAHKQEVGTDTFPCKKMKNGKEIIPPESFRISFCPDGVKDRTNSHVEVLFILKESNLDNGDELAPETKDTFWFCDKPDESEKYRRGLEQALKQLVPDPDNARYGYMNINKRGGYGTTDGARLKRYAQEYRSFIKKQIELHSPKVIVCCGCFDAMAGILDLNTWARDGVQRYAYGEGQESTAEMFYIYHPSYSNFKRGLENLDKSMH